MKRWRRGSPCRRLHGPSDARRGRVPVLSLAALCATRVSAQTVGPVIVPGFGVGVGVGTGSAFGYYPRSIYGGFGYFPAKNATSTPRAGGRR